MKSNKVTIGRASSSNDVDFDLLLEGASYRISRRQVLYDNTYPLLLNASLLYRLPWRSVKVGNSY